MTTTNRPTGGAAARRAARWAVAACSAGVLAGSLAGCSFTGSVEDAGAASGTPTSSSPSASGSPSPSSGAPSSATTSTGAPGGPAESAGTSTGPAGSSGSSGGGGSSAGGGTAGGSGAATTCRTSDLALSLLPGEGGASAGHQHFTIQLANRGATACTLDGHPGVSLVTGDAGQQLGAAASREGTPALVRLGPGASAYADLSVAQAGDYDASQCQPQAAKGLRVYPPDQTASAFVPADGLTGCASSSVVLLVVDPVVAGR